MTEQEVKELLWSKSPFNKGDKMFLHPEYCQGLYSADEPLEIMDIGYFPRNELFPFEYECKFSDGHSEWLKGHALVTPDWKDGQ